MILNTKENYIINKYNQKIKLSEVQTKILHLMSDNELHTFKELNNIIYGDDLISKTVIRKYISILKNEVFLHFENIRNIGYKLNDKINIAGITNYLTENEYNYLYNLIKPFKSKVMYICKFRKSNEKYYISIAIKYEQNIILPGFEKDSIYKNLELNKKYKLEDLGL